MKGTITIMPGTDLTAPACPECADLADEKCDKIAQALLQRRRTKA
jgi:hypothetical protein